MKGSPILGPAIGHIPVGRRHFLLGGILAGTATAATAAAGPMRWAGGQGRQTIALFDGRIEDGRRFAVTARLAGHTVHDTGLDVAVLLYGPLRPLLRPGVLLAGVTRYADFQVASAIAREHGRALAGAVCRHDDGPHAYPVIGPADGQGHSAEDMAELVPAFRDAAATLRQCGSIAWICA